ncbi:hypothetical protein AMTRI_Chr03g54370 [Amborella trichopoda]|uniref:DNA-directed RNA polymerase subunit n=1 Tax=Amborella trichopoda TaxID=13333 RepID=W1P388_AMBTC|nr:DNA-directed RNA polymerase V subunit 7 isoform X1 [Amborella trichopoda]XP_020519863.1 DNA-directed RNA polymerase V subunit 7 isoform X1 [Amborella trichopoda]ERN01420.1 hypothetical protein AMTR_s00002p00265350 [Amborella trichopoda]|eukprot:XP_006838851.1 DNA-directed RNA polymerase V subunit 7 isoform X1 [Amborella trichopoda]
MFLEIEMKSNVVVPPDQLYQNLLLHRSIILKLLEDVAHIKATQKHGYLVAVTSLKERGEGKVRDFSGEVIFPVVFKCLTFKPFVGEILHGVITQIMKHGIILKCGPVENVFLSLKKMEDFKYVHGENPIFVNDKNLKLERHGVVRFRVLALQWMEGQREFMLLASLEGDFLGPVSGMENSGLASSKCL